MLVKPPKTIEDFETVKKTIIELMGNPFCDHLMFMSLSYRLKNVEDKIKELEDNK